MIRRSPLFLVIAPVCALLACVPLAGCGAISAVRRGGTTEALADNNSATAIKSRMNRARTDGFRLGDVDVEVTGGVVLLSGNVPTEADRIEAERIAWTGDTVREVANEIAVGEGGGAASGARDELTAAQVRTALLNDSQVRGVNYNVEVVGGVVYLLGVARSGEELERAAGTAARVNGVERVITYVRIDEAAAAQ